VADTPDSIAATIARNVYTPLPDALAHEIAAAIREAVAAEREACAAIADEMREAALARMAALRQKQTLWDDTWADRDGALAEHARQFAASIRARGGVR
jgi:hypothetical protein